MDGKYSLYYPVKHLTKDAYERYYLKLLKRALARTEAFKDGGKNYYWYRLEYLDKLNGTTRD